MQKGNITRRDFLTITGVGSAALLLNACAPLKTDQAIPPGSDPDIELAIVAAPGKIQILDGAKTEVWQYQGEVLKGPQDALQVIPGSYLGPIIRARKGQTVRVHFTNEIPEPTIIHWHGLHVPESADGHPRLAIDNGETYVYEFTVMDRAGTYWYHPHPHGRTAPQVIYGLAGLFIVSDDEEDQLDLPVGDFDLPLVIQDRTFDGNNQFIYNLDGMTLMRGFMGDQVLINGFPNFEQSTAANPHRLRVLNGSNARVYALAWSDGSPLTVIGTDGGLLEKPEQRDYLVLSPGERVDLWADFSGYEVGDQLQLVSINPKYGKKKSFPLVNVRIDRPAESEHTLPAVLSALSFHEKQDAVNLDNPRQFLLSMGMHRQWFINGKQFEMTRVDKNETVRLGDLEVWDFVNLAEHGMGVLEHPMHIHGLQFQVLERESTAEYSEDNAMINQGQVDTGWKDTVLVMPGERVRVLLKFEDFEGLYLYHCHNLEHEDMGMMRNYRVTA
jgi:FtsP/CotA-like multicopper oxidase with cupredoxin domain